MSKRCSVGPHVTYFESHLAAAQAQQIWDHSVISKRFHEGHVRRVRYGFEEVETEYRVWIGKLEDQQEQWPWEAQETREEYMSQGALRETLLRALDVHGYRLFADMPHRYFDDERLLRSMHRLRAKSHYQSDEARRDSEQWLLAHPGKA